MIKNNHNLLFYFYFNRLKNLFSIYIEKTQKEILSEVFIFPGPYLFWMGILCNHLKTAFDLSNKIQPTLLWSLLWEFLCLFLVRLKALDSLLISNLRCLKIPFDTPIDLLIKYVKNPLSLFAVSLIVLCKLNDFVRVGKRKLRFFNVLIEPLYSTSVSLSVNSALVG